MPRANKESALARQWELLKLLPGRSPGKPARDLCEALEARGHPVTKRTIERDLGDLSEIFPIECNRISTPYGWYWSPEAHFKIPGMDLAEALSLGLLEEVLRQLVPSSFVSALEGRFAEARSKLAGLPGNTHARWSDLVRYLPPGIPFLAPEVVPGIVREVQNALLEQRQLKAGYLGAGESEPKDLVLHPLALVHQGVRCYLLATAFDYDKPFLYALYRFEWAEMTSEKANRPEGFTLDRYLSHGGGQFGARKPIRLKARITEDLARLLGETPLSENQTITGGGEKRTLTATVFDSWQLHFWILSQGPAIAVQQPAGLRRLLVAQLKETLENY